MLKAFNGMASHIASPGEKKFESALLVGIIMVTVIWAERGVRSASCLEGQQGILNSIIKL
jgi:hypothetical protein